MPGNELVDVLVQEKNIPPAAASRTRRKEAQQFPELGQPLPLHEPRRQSGIFKGKCVYVSQNNK